MESYGSHENLSEVLWENRFYGTALWRQLYKNKSSGKTDSQLEKRSSGSLLEIVSENRFSGKTYFYTIHPCLLRRFLPSTATRAAVKRITTATALLVSSMLKWRLRLTAQMISARA